MYTHMFIYAYICDTFHTEFVAFCWPFHVPSKHGPKWQSLRFHEVTAKKSPLGFIHFGWKYVVYPPEMEVLYGFIWENHGNISGIYHLVI